MVTKIISHWWSTLFLRKFEWIIWDYDGTLWQSEAYGRDLKKAFFEVLLEETGKNISADKFDKLIEQHGSWSKAVEQQTEGIKESSIIDLAEKKCPRSSYLSNNQNIVKLISKLGKKQLILSNALQADVNSGLKQLGFLKNKQTGFHGPFLNIFGRDHFNCLKPDRRIFEALHSYTRSSKKRHLIIGDSDHHDIIPARSYGFKAMHVSRFLNLYLS